MRDLVDRLVEQQRASNADLSLQNRVMLEHARIAEENNDFLWRAIIAEMRALITKYNGTFRNQFYLTPEDPEGEKSVMVSCSVFPLASLTLSRPSPHFFEFSIDRTQGSFAPRKGTNGRIDVKPDSNRNVPMVAQDGTPLPTPLDVAEYLLEPLFRPR
jgi:hypothetical protein